MQIINNAIPNVTTPKAPSSKAQDSAKALDAFNQRLKDIQENRDLRAAVAERNAEKGLTA